MKKGLLLLLLLFSFCGVIQAQVDVFYLPDSGFLRVSGDVTLNPSTTELSFVVFPGAQITEFWADDLIDYAIERRSHQTEVHFNLRQARRQNLSFSYEGFVEPELAQVFLGRDQLWFPELSFPVEPPHFTLQIPLIWEFQGDNVFDTEKHGSFQIVHWTPDLTSYPNFQARNITIATAEAPEVSEVPEVLVEIPVENVEIEVPQKPTRSPVEELIARVEMQITRLTNAINQRDERGVEQILTDSLQEKGLAHYLASLPWYYGKVVSERVNNPVDAADEFQVLFSTDRGHRFLASMVWHEGGDWPKLEAFRLVPFEGEIPSEVVASVEDFLLRLQSALRVADTEELEALLAPDLAQGKQPVMEFLSSLTTSQRWSYQQITMEPFSVVVLVPHSENSRFLLHLELTPGLQHWLIQSIQIFPLS